MGVRQTHEACTVLDLERQHRTDRSDRLASSSCRNHHRSTRDAAVTRDAEAGDQPCSSNSLSAGGSGNQRQQRNEETRNNPGSFVCIT